MLNKKMTLLNMFRMNFLWVLGMIVCSVLLTLSNIYMRAKSGNIIDALFTGESWGRMGIYIIILALIVFLCSFIRTYMLGIYCSRTAQFLYKRMVDCSCYGRQSWAEQQDLGQAVTLFTSDIDGIIRYITRIIDRFVPDTLIFLFSVGMIIYIHPMLGVVAVISASMPVLVLTISSRRLKRNNYTYQESLKDANQAASYGLFNLEMVKAYSLEEKYTQNYNHSLTQLQMKKNKLAFGDAALSAPSLFASFITMFAVAALGGWLTVNEQITLGSFFTTLTLVDFIISPVMSLDGTLSNVRSAQSNLVRLNAYLDTPMENNQHIDFKADRQAGIQFHDVSFAYQEGKLVLEHFCANFRQGECVYILGNNGCGKSTILRLIAGVYFPDSGSVTVLGKDTKDWDLTQLRESISISTQEIVLFAESIFDNLQMGNSKIKQEDIERACKLTGIHNEIVVMSEGYQTVLTEGGKPLSRGQRQRLALARAFLKGSPILILDEPTASLDANNVLEIKKALKEIAKDKIVLIITHDPKLIDSSCNILKLGGCCYEK